jgi:tetratricopeptide (TPR) repeat protein
MKKKTAQGLVVVLLLYVLLGAGCPGDNPPPPVTDDYLVGKSVTIKDADGTEHTLVFQEDEVLVDGTAHGYTADGKTINIEGVGKLSYTKGDTPTFASDSFFGKAVPSQEAPLVTAPENPADIPESVQELIDQGAAALAEGKYDAAIDAFEKSYKKDAADPKAVVYSSLARLASIAKDKEVKALLENRLGVQNYPGTIDSLIAMDWFQEYPSEEFVWDYREEIDGQQRWIEWYGEVEHTVGFDAYPTADMPEGVTKPGYYYWKNEDVSLGSEPKTAAGTEIKSPTTINEQWCDWRILDGTPAYYTWEYGNYIWVSNTPQYYAAGEALSSYYDTETNREISLTMDGYIYRDTRHVLVSETPKYETYKVKLPGIASPDWFKGTEMYERTLTVTSGRTVESAATMSLNIFTGLLDKNTNGLNDLLDGVLSAVFGSGFEEAATRIGTMKYEDRVELDAKVYAEFGLDEILEGEKLYIGRAELDLLIAALRVVKASLEWLTAYDWNTDLSFLRTDWVGDGVLTSLKALDAGKLPLNNNFLKDRGNGAIDRAKADYLKAIDAALAAYDQLGAQGPQVVKDMVADLAGVKAGLIALKTAIETGVSFYVPQDDPIASGLWNATADNAALGLDMKLFFTPGAFSLNKLIETAAGKPVFYGFPSEGDPVALPANADLTLYEGVGIGLTLKPLDDLVSPGLELTDAVEPLYFPKEIGEVLYKKYNGLPL